MFKYSPNGKDMIMAPVEKSPNGKGIMATTPLIYSPNGKGMVLWKILYRSVMVKYKNAMVKIKNIQYKR